MKQQVHIGLVILAIALFAALVPFNHDPVPLRLWGAHQWNLPLAALLGIAFIGGALLMLSWRWLGLAGDAVDRRLFQWEPRARKVARGYIKRGYEAMRKGEEAAAKSYFTAARREDPRFAEGYLAMAKWLRRNEKHDLAFEEAQKASELEPKNHIMLEELAKCAIDASRPGDAADAFIGLLKVRPESEYALRMLPLALADAGRWDEAFETQKRFVESLPKDGRVLAMETWRGIKSELAASAMETRPKLAIKLLRQALKEDPAFVHAAIQLSEWYKVAGKVEAARKTLLNALKIRPEPIIFEQLINLETEKNPDTKAAIDEILGSNPNHSGLQLTLARYLLINGKIDEARQELSKVEEGGDPFRLLLMAIISRKTDSEAADAAETELLKSMKIEHVCSHCGGRGNGWVARCRECRHWNTMVSQ